jgi:hypothetical protein
MDGVLERLLQLRLIKPSFDVEAASTGGPAQVELLKLCGAAALEGSLSVALDVRADELIGPLVSTMGGMAAELKVIEVRDEPRPELTVRLAGLQTTWSVPDLDALVGHLNTLFKADPSTKAVAILGEWDDALQLWALDKRALPELLQESFFLPRNREELFTLAHAPTSS